MSHLDEGVLHAVLDGEVPADELGPIQRHLAECRECQTRFEEARQFRDESLGMIEQLDPAPVAFAMAASPSPAYHSAPAEAIAAIQPAARRPRWPVMVAWAATLIVAVGLGYQMAGLRRARRFSPATANELAIGTPPPLAPLAARESLPQPVPVTDENDKLYQVQSVEPKSAVAPPQPAALADAKKSAPDSAPRPTQAIAEVAAAPAPPPAKVPTTPPESTPPSEAERERANVSGLAASRAKPEVSTDLDRGGAQAKALRRDLLKADGPVPLNPADQRRRTISAATAIAALGGSIRLVDGLTPARFEQQGEVVQVIYRTGFGTVVLRQWRTGELLAHELVAPPDVPADSVRAWERRIR
jgi:negative regulator of sigma E activity